MNRLYCSLVVLAVAPCLRADPPLVLVSERTPAVGIYAPGENEAAGKRLADRLQRLTGATIPVAAGDAPPQEPAGLIAVGSPATNPVVRDLLADQTVLGKLGDEGYLLKVGTLKGRRMLLASGRTLAGTNNAVSELVTWRLKTDSDRTSVDGALDVHDVPALKYRLLWNWDARTNWAPTVAEMHAVPYQRYTLIEQGEAGFLTHFRRALEFYSDHKLNGLIIWGFLQTQHGGLRAGREISHYARLQNVRILPGVCTEGAYGGFSFEKDSTFNFDFWTSRHPELRFKMTNGDLIAGICPSKDQNLQWLREGTEWMFKNLPDIGGMNLENGDWFYCWTDDCVAAKSRPENDPSFFWDMMASARPVLETAQRIRPDAWMTLATYTGFSEKSIHAAMDGAKKTRRATGIATEIVYPPRFLKQLPANTICQWTLTGMAGPQAWPEETRLPEANFKDHIGYIHQGGVVSGPTDPKRWWAGPGGAGYEDVSEMIQFVCSRAHHAGMAGLAMYGERGAASPANELNYLAFEYFTWHPERSYEEFINERLGIWYGGEDAARRFLGILRNTTKDAAGIQEDRRVALTKTRDRSLDSRQQARWQNLADELDRRLKLLPELK